MAVAAIRDAHNLDLPLSARASYHATVRATGPTPKRRKDDAPVEDAAIALSVHRFVAQDIAVTGTSGRCPTSFCMHNRDTLGHRRGAPSRRFIALATDIMRW